jgi:diguanylate cyclase (GGDEF)-like protein/PAS domain S-box-containing protein
MASSIGSIILQLLQNVSLFALVLAGYAAIRSYHARKSHLTDAAVGLIFGLGAVLAMTQTIYLAYGVNVDGRSILTGLVAIFSGPIGTAVTVIMVTTYRIMLGGPAAPAGCAGAIGAGLISLTFWALQRRHSFKFSAPSLAILGFSVVTQSVLFFALLNPEANAEHIRMVAIPLYMVVPLGTIVLGLALLAQDERLSLQARLREQTRLLETVFRSMGDGVTVTNAQGKIILANPAAQRLSGVSVEGGPGNDRFEVYGVFEPDGVTRVPERRMPLQRAMQGESINNTELIYHNERTGGPRLLSVNGRPLRDERGKVQGGVAVFRDITEQNQLQESLRRADERFALAIAGSKDGISDYNLATGEIWFSLRFKEMLGYNDSDFPNDVAFFNDLIARTDRAVWEKQLADLEAGRRENIDLVQRVRHKQGHLLHINTRAQGVRDKSGKIVRLVAAATDITPVIRAEARLIEAVNSIHEGFVLLDADLNIVVYNERMLRLYRRSAEAFAVGINFAEVLRYGAQQGEYPGVSTPEEVERFVAEWMTRYSSAEPYVGEGSFDDGRWVLISHRRTASGNYVSVRTDISTLKQREAELEAAKAKLEDQAVELQQRVAEIEEARRRIEIQAETQTTLVRNLTKAQIANDLAVQESQRIAALLRSVTDAVPALVAFIGKDQRYAYCNDEYRDVYGVDPQSLLGQKIINVVEPEIYAAIEPHVKAVLDGKEVSFVRPMVAKGEMRVVQQRYIPQIDANGSVSGFYAIAWDITESHQREARLSKEVMTDVLTGLLNRRAMMLELAQESRLWRENGLSGAVMFLDVDHFKKINDTLGHDIGDEVLKVFAERVKSAVRSSDKVARLGGDEFVVLLTAPDSETVARRIAKTLLDRIREPFNLQGKTVHVSTSIGIAVTNGTMVYSPEQILKEADLGLYEAKTAGRDGFALRKME